MTKAEVFAELKKQGWSRTNNDYHAYEACKKHLMNGKVIGLKSYDRIVKYIADYLGL